MVQIEFKTVWRDVINLCIHIFANTVYLHTNKYSLYDKHFFKLKNDPNRPTNTLGENEGKKEEE